MKNVSTAIRADGEVKKFSECLALALSSNKAYPIAVNGLSGGAETAFICESVKEAHRLTASPVLILAESDGECERICEKLSSAGLRSARFKKRDLIFHNIRASHDVDRERLSVLSSLLRGELDAVVTTPSAASVYTMPQDMLSELRADLECGGVIEPSELCARLANLGYAEVEAVDGRGQFSRRGGIVDFWGGDSDMPVRAEFFGDEIDRLAYFDPLTQRFAGECEHITLLPANEVIVNGAAREKILSAVRRLEKNAKDSLVKEKLTREIAALEGGLSIDFRDKYLGLISGESNLFTYFSSVTGDGAAVFNVGSSGCAEDMRKSEEFYSTERESMLSSGLVCADAAKYTSSSAVYREFLEKNICIHNKINIKKE